jgi:hypothetical protein
MIMFLAGETMQRDDCADEYGSDQGGKAYA